jgi:hypothetical protein
MWLLIDDERDLNCDAIARTPEAARVLLKCDCWECVIFDHDLGCAKTGYDILMWMFESKVYPRRIQLVTSNPVGRDRMSAVLKENHYSSKDGYNYFKD